MFDGIVDRYDLLNGLLSLGLDRRWRRECVRAVAGGGGSPVLDLGCGTGELGRAMVRAAPAVRVVGLDVSAAMLEAARRGGTPRTGSRAGDSPVRLVRGSAFRLPFADGAFSGAVSGFVLRNLDDLPRAFAELARVIRPGGRVGLVDVTEPRNPAVRRLFDAYFGIAAPALGSLIGKREAYRYLVRSLAQIPSHDRVCELMAAAGFDWCRARPLTGGMVTLFTGSRTGESAGG
jgi:demethylmenaquinone methyltransferase/2-methoxy-6-polyprenyl-1,4-benzoquinol methylase